MKGGSRRSPIPGVARATPVCGQEPLRGTGTGWVTNPEKVAVWALGLGLSCLWLVGCFEIPVRRHLELVFTETGSLRLTLLVELADGDQAEEAVKQRLEREEEELLRSEDPWSGRFAAVRARVEGLSWQKENGRLRRLRRTAEIGPNELLDDPGPLGRFWSDTTIYPQYTYEEATGAETTGAAELVLYPGRSDRSTRREARRIEDTLTEWADALFEYLQRVEALYTYLDANPDRTLICFGQVFDHEFELAPATELELELTEGLTEAMFEALKPFATQKGQDESLEEISRRVFDPFPARVSIRLPAEPLEVEGFVESGDRWIVPGLSLWGALEALGGSWVWPNPLISVIENELAGSADSFDLPAYAGQPRRTALPYDSLEIEQQIRDLLEPAEQYRLRWPLNVGPDEGDLSR